MDKQFYFLSPVEVVKVTSQNLEETAEWCGGSVQETESRRVPGRMDKYVLVPTPKDTNISWAFPGMFITKRLVVTVKDELRSTFAVFRRDYFDKNYFETPKDAVEKTWEREELEKHQPKREEHPVVNNVGQKLLEAQARIKTLEAEAEARNAPAAFTDEEWAGGKYKETTFIHDHKSTEMCVDSDCACDRYIDGLHQFTDIRIIATPEGYREILNAGS